MWVTSNAKDTGDATRIVRGEKCSTQSQIFVIIPETSNVAKEVKVYLASLKYFYFDFPRNTLSVKKKLAESDLIFGL